MEELLPPWEPQKAEQFTARIENLLAGLKPSRSGAVTIANIPKETIPAIRFYGYLEENFSPNMAQYAIRINTALYSYIPDEMDPCGYYEVDNTIDALRTQHAQSAAAAQINDNLRAQPIVRGITLNRENLLRILRYEKDEEFRKEAYHAATNAHPENAQLFEEMLRGQRAQLRRVICENPTEFLEKYAKTLKHDGRAAWNWAYVGEPHFLPARAAIRDAIAHISRVFHVDFYQTRANLWAPMDVYEVGRTGRYVILDLWNRAGKSRRVPFTLHLGTVSIVVCYYDDQIDQYDLTTFYHEMGHALHFCFSAARTLLVPIEDDFGEIPGVVMEYIAEPNTDRQIAIGRQVAIGLFDQYTQRGEKPELAATAAFAQWLPGGAGRFWQSFEHFSMGYGGSYYSYALAYWYAERLVPLIKAAPERWFKLLRKVGQRPAKQLLDKFMSRAEITVTEK